jgi:hypothetical protein
VDHHNCTLQVVVTSNLNAQYNSASAARTALATAMRTHPLLQIQSSIALLSALSVKVIPLLFKSLAHGTSCPINKQILLLTVARKMILKALHILFCALQYSIRSDPIRVLDRIGSK